MHWKPCLFARESTLEYNETDKRLGPWYANCLEQVTPEMINRKFFCSFISGDTLHTSTIQHLKYKCIIQYLTLEIVHKIINAHILLFLAW